MPCSFMTPFSMNDAKDAVDFSLKRFLTESLITLYTDNLIVFEPISMTA